MDRRLVAILVAVVVALGVGVAVGAGIWAGGDHGDDSASASTGHGTSGMMMSGSMDEQLFLEEMVPHHEAAVEMATMALEKSTRPQVRQLAQEIIDAQEGEISQMREWYRQWYGTALPESGASQMDLGNLDTVSGSEFDRLFLRKMIAHHASAILMADLVSMNSPRQEIATLGSEIIAAQSKEIGRMQSWRAQWFPPRG